MNTHGQIRSISCSCCGSLHFDIGNNGIYERGRSAEEDPYLFQVLITSVIVCEVGLFVGLSFYHIAFVWYYPVAAFFGAFVIAIICTRGWDYLISIFKRFYKGGDKEKWHE